MFGGGAVGGILIDADDETKRQVIRKAMDAGINWIDTASSYGNGASEEALGWLLQELDEDPYLSTKFRIDTTGLADLPGQIEASLTASLIRLRRDSVTLLQLHNPIGAETRGRLLGETEILRRGGVLDSLERLREQGLIGHFGITALGETSSILNIIKSGRIDSAQVYYNLLNPSAAGQLPRSWPVYDFSGVLQACDEHGVAAMNIRVFSAGVLATDERTGREQPLTPGDTVESETEKARRLFSVLADKHGSRAQTAIRFALAEPRLACVVFGLAEIQHLEEAVAGAMRGALPRECLDEIVEIYQSRLSD